MTKFQALQILGLSGTVNHDDIKQAYHRKAAQYHPDRNPVGSEIMKLINQAYDLVKNEQEDIIVFHNEQMAHYPSTLGAAINAISALAGLNIDICGLWVWVSGESRTHKDVLKAAGYRYAPKKQRWYYRPTTALSRNRTGAEWTMNEINDYGVIPVQRGTHTGDHRLQAA